MNKDDIMKKMNIDKLTQLVVIDTKEKLYALAGGALLFFLLYTFFFLRPAFMGFINSSRRISELKYELFSLEDDMDHKHILELKAADMDNKVELYGGKLPAEQEIPILLSELSDMAKETHVKILGISPIQKAKKGMQEKTVKKPPYEEIPIRISAESGYHELGRFINELENAKRFIKVSDIEINSNQSNKTAHDIELVVSTYVLAQD